MTDKTEKMSNGVTSKKDSQTNKLKELCANNAEFFAKDSSENGQRLYISFLAIIDCLDSMSPKLVTIEKRVPEFDYDEEVVGNGYRSYLSVVDMAIQLAIDISDKVLQRRESVLFWKNNLTKDIELCSHLLTSLDGCLDYLKTLLSWSKNSNLFTDDSHSPRDLLLQCGEINQHCFYGRFLGFQYCNSLKNILQVIALSMTLFSEVYYSQGSLISKATNSVMSTTKYITDPEQRAKRIVNIFRNSEVDFCKAFWFLSETDLLNHLPSIVSPGVAVSLVINLPPEPLYVDTDDGKRIEVPIPSAYIGRKSIQLRLISHKLRQGMIGTKTKTAVAPPAKGLLFHCHGGGFVAQSSKSHEGYLRDWAKQLDVPILCVDYSLAPEAPFPRALEEVLYAYCWAKNNSNLLGSTGECIVGAGDSAGANLLLATTLKCIHMGLPQLKGIFVAYAPTGANFIPSPSRMLSLMDPLLPFGFMIRCLKAYCCPNPKLKRKSTSSDSNSETESFEEITESDLMELQAHKSPVSATSDTLTYDSLTSNDDIDNNDTKLPVTTNTDPESSQQYVSEFLEKYVLDSDTDTNGTKISVIRPESIASSTEPDYSIQKRLSSFIGSLKNNLTKYLGERTFSGAEKFLDLDNNQNSMVDIFSFTVPKDPYMSPIFASDEDLRKFPPIRILSTHLDPFLDDSVTLGKRFKKLNSDVKLDVLGGLSHGFLNFSLFSREAYDGSKVCIGRIKELLNK